MKRGLLITLGIILVVGFILYRLFAGTYNNLVDREEGVKNAWSQVENQYQRRADLIPNLVETVKGYANFEKETLTQVIQARADATKVTVDPTKLTPDKMAQFQQAQDGLSSALGRLMVVVEKYPDLKANENFRDLQAQLEGTENRISVERKRFNDVVLDYNKYRRGFPNNLLAGMYGFEEKGYFQAQAGADKAPSVKF
jgi:LemA protein